MVVGCGLGDDAAALAERGYDVTGIDLAPTALRWARRRFRHLAIDWRRLDLLDADARAALEGRFDLVVEVATVPYLPGVVREAAMDAIGRLAAPGGVLVVVTWLATGAKRSDATPGPPWGQAPSELAAYRSGGLVRLALEHPPRDTVMGPLLEARVTLQRPRGT